MTASGFAGLGYQIVWTQQCALWLGHEAAAVLAVVTAFFGGLALGALALGPTLKRTARPALWYAACEAAIALWSVALALGLAPVSGWLLDLTGAQPTATWQWTVSFFGTLVVLLPATAAMGATLPAMERVVAALGNDGRSIAALYASNTLGAVIGVLAAAFWLVPEWGLARTAMVCGALNLFCAIAALALPRGSQPAAPSGPAPADRRPLVRLAVTGLLGIGYEVLVVRVLSQVAENTVYTYAMLLAVYLVGSALGAAAYQRWRTRSADADALRDRLICLQAAACLIGTLTLWQADVVRHSVAQGLGAGMNAALAAEAAIALAAFGLPTIAMGALFSHLSLQATQAGWGFGRALGFNTLGAAFAPLLFGVLLLPALGHQVSLLLVAAGYLALLATPGWRRPLAWGTAASAIVLALWAPPLVFVDVPPGGRVISYREGPMAAVSVVEDADGVSRLRIDNRQQEGSSASRLADARQALLPLLLHPAPQRALFLGLGTGVTASSAAEDPTLQVDVVELLPEVVAASAHFTQALASGASNPRLHIMTSDARRYVRTTDARYDVIVSDNFHPARSGSGALYTVEHFAAVRERLTEQGVFCQWLPLHQLDLDTLRSIVRAFVAVHPGGWAMLATNSLETPVLGLVARRDGGRFDWAQVRARRADAQWPQPLADFGLADDWALLGGFVAGPQALARFAGTAPVNTDDHPVVMYRAPRITYAPDSLPRDRLSALLNDVRIEPGELIDSGADAAAPQRLAAYWSARDRFIEAGQAVRPTSDLRQMLSQVRDPLLSVLRISADFRPAYDPLLRMANALGETDVAAARSLLSELQRLQPARAEASQAWSRLAGERP